MKKVKGFKNNKILFLVLIALMILLLGSCRLSLDLNVQNLKTISFNSNGGSYVEPIVQEAGTLVFPPNDPLKEGYIFDGWYSDYELTLDYTFITMPENNINLFARWIVTPIVLQDYELELKNGYYEIVK